MRMRFTLWERSYTYGLCAAKFSTLTSQMQRHQPYCAVVNACAGQRVMQAANMVLEAVEWVQKTHPKIWQRRGGRDHIYLIPNDEGVILVLQCMRRSAT